MVRLQGGEGNTGPQGLDGPAGTPGRPGPTGTPGEAGDGGSKVHATLNTQSEAMGTLKT